MATHSKYSKIGYAGFGASIFAFLGPGLHFTQNPGVSRSQLGTEAAILGIILGVVGLILGLLAKRGILRLGDTVGLSWARAGVVISVAGIVVWGLVLAIGFATGRLS